VAKVGQVILVVKTNLFVAMDQLNIVLKQIELTVVILLLQLVIKIAS